MKYSTISDIVLERIREDILSGRLKPGEKINQNRLTKELGVSIIPLREAFKRLQAEGYINIIPHRGAYVGELSHDEIEDIYLVRAELEELAAALAAENLTEDDIKTLRALFRSMKKATKEHRRQELLALNRKFHFTIYRACRRKHLLEILEDLWDRSSRYRNLQTFLPRRAEEELKEHKQILEACQNGVRKSLMTTIRVNVEQSRRSLTSPKQIR
ncbi:MAG TPA: GntR family transcriptional regulator [Acidobacteriota bacterium]|jgi:DNA-binding GntR family transcriptional regulator|nr:GntR family transcriptional regulator [Acidobacteriota bacterium]